LVAPERENHKPRPFPIAGTLGFFVGTGAMLLAFVIVFALVTVGLHPSDLAKFQADPLPLGLIALTLSYPPLLAYFAIATPRLVRLSWSELGARKPETTRVIASGRDGLALGLLTLWLHGTQHGEARWLLADPAHLDLVCYLATALVLGPLTEEIVFRVVLLGALRTYVREWLAIAISAIIFAAVHFSIHELLPLALLGWMLGVAYTRSRNLWPAIAGHTAYNLVGVIVSLTT
jgi:membrane protease YdiL (CAAX protease family)